MKKVLILTTSTGQGHNQAADSISASFENSGYKTIKYDFLYKSSKFLSDLIVTGYEILASRFPSLYGLFYSLTNNKFTNTLLKLVFFFTKKKLYKLINETKPDIIIATHSLSVNIVTSLKKHGLTIPYIMIVTDFKAHYTYINQYVDAYITGSEYTKQSLIDKGINKDKIYPIGIPIKKIFYTKNNSLKNLNDDYFSLLLMSGSLGLNTISLVLKELLKSPHKLRITVVCGKNKKLENSLNNYCSNNSYDNKKLHILGFTKDIPVLMDYCDIIISKPGGLTVTESIVKNIPLIVPFAIPGQEMENTEFLVKSGYSIYIKDLNKINNTVEYLINNPMELKNLKDKLIVQASNYSVDEIVNIAENLINKNK
ncbi:UDP-N-acetylglucosamine--LPS N-acetylglucosamine transferase [Clostridium botulinum]|uniref:UDP-N-acetylglucosamine--LPS N-acetylglucosamine transferase n=1 Tax=Clostridium botulinum TaxID=1491 RepID=A0A0L9Y7B0_CLOBO|nr:glycosyltransferase [Clostridium botulinum]KAI3348021.1 UDP-N-acetylglucosamine--LPS N-acetylglucosamine transferase [Clostridium botulinum]KOM87478.1 galactosyldiacylglycerol synthase [Clostridium botulinum]KOR65541.1 galactosyldiacylglycerol synthase [Clostridium botulinum]MBN1040889.1 UDP-N-acetylglucosamine--LPS N-acetylglucosamine transferase [Clostridium botulinum]MBN1047528.1 UDP-N-acetylglucosamine--LPS N-acetylglucosamine transferase [Clostridium botulinum]